MFYGLQMFLVLKYEVYLVIYGYLLERFKCSLTNFRVPFLSVSNTNLLSVFLERVNEYSKGIRTLFINIYSILIYEKYSTVVVDMYWI